jgi:hypothetical protein
MMTANDIPTFTRTAPNGAIITAHPKHDVLHRGNWHGGERVAYTQRIDTTLNGATTTTTLAYWARPDGAITRILPASA